MSKFQSEGVRECITTIKGNSEEEKLSLEEIERRKEFSRKFDERLLCALSECEEEELQIWQLQMEAHRGEAITTIVRKSEEKKRNFVKKTLREAITTIERKSEEKKRKFGKKTLRKAITTINDKSEEKKRNFVETIIAYEPQKEKRFSVSVKLPHIAVRK